MAGVASITAVVVGWMASVMLLGSAEGDAVFALGTTGALAIWSVVGIVTIAAVRTRERLDRLAPLALTASAVLFTVLAFDAVA